MKRKSVLTMSLIIAVSVLFVMLNACKKEEPPKAEVLVLNGESSNTPVEGAIVRVYAERSDAQHLSDDAYIDPDSSIVQEIMVTDESGKTYHEFAFESILLVEAKWGRKKNDTLVGIGALILKFDETYEETVILKKQQ